MLEGARRDPYGSRGPGPARPIPSARRSTASGRTSPCSPRWRRGVAVPVRRRRDARRGSTCPSATRSAGTATCPASRPASATATACTARGDPDHGLRCNPRKLLLDPYAKAIDGEVGWNEAVFAYRFDDPDGSPNDADSAPFMPKSVVINPYFDWGDDRRPHTPLHETVIYELHVKGFTDTPPDVPDGAARHLRRPRAPGGDRVPAVGSASPRSSCCRCTSSCTTRTSLERGPAQLLGLQLDRLLRAAQRLRVGRSARRSRSQEFKQMVQGAAPRRHRGDPRRRLQPHRRGQPPRPDAVVQGHRQPGLLPARPDDPRYYYDYTGTGNSLNMRHPHVLQLIMDSLRYWVTEMHVDGFRFDLAATLARELHEVDRLSAFFDLIQQDPVVSQVEADRRAVGRRRGRLPGRQLPAAVVGVERQVPRRRARLLARRGRDARRVRLPPHRQLRPLRGRRPAPGRRASTSSPRTTASRCATSSRTTRSTTRRTARTTATARATTARGTAASRAPTDDPEVNALRARQQRNFLATLLLSQGVPMLARRRRARPHAARQQQRLLPGQRDLVARLGRRRRRAAGVRHAG